MSIFMGASSEPAERVRRWFLLVGRKRNGNRGPAARGGP